MDRKTRVETLPDHDRTPRPKRVMEGADVAMAGGSPSRGDVVTVSQGVRGRRVGGGRLVRRGGVCRRHGGDGDAPGGGRPRPPDEGRDPRPRPRPVDRRAGTDGRGVAGDVRDAGVGHAEARRGGVPDRADAGGDRRAGGGDRLRRCGGLVDAPGTGGRADGAGGGRSVEEWRGGSRRGVCSDAVDGSLGLASTMHPPDQGDPSIDA